MLVKTLSSFASGGFPFNDTLEHFFDNHNVKEDVECYQLLFCPYGDGTSFDDLYNIKFQSKIVILNIADNIIDKFDNLAIDELTEFCNSRPEHKFIIFTWNLGFNKLFSHVPNLYLDTLLNSDLSEQLKPCEKKEITNRWLCLNSDTKFHKVMSVSYLLSKSYNYLGSISFNLEMDALVHPNEYKRITPIPKRLKESFNSGFKLFKDKDFELLDIRNFDKNTDTVGSNYNNNLMSTMETVGVEIINGTLFFENSPGFSEKEFQNIFAKNFPIYINGVGTVREIKEFWGIDLFDDIVDHSYDEIEDHFERMVAAIDRNEHLLDGSTNIQKLWLDNQKRFDSNVEKCSEMMWNVDVRNKINADKIKKGLRHFKVSVTKKTKSLPKLNATPKPKKTRKPRKPKVTQESE